MSGLAREMPRCEPPRKWIRLTASIVSGVTCSMSPSSTTEAVADADDVDAFEDGANRRRTDDAVDAGRRPTADENSELLVMFHLRPPTPNASTAQLMIEGGLLNREAPRPFSVSTAAELVSRDTIGTHTTLPER